MNSELLSQIKQIISDNAGIDTDSINEDSNLFDDLNIDSIDMEQITLALQQQFAIEINIEDMEQFQTVGDIERFISNQ